MSQTLATFSSLAAVALCVLPLAGLAFATPPSDVKS